MSQDDSLESSSSAFIKTLPLNPANGSTWIGHCRLLACAANVIMIMGMYLEYLWAAEWDDIPSHCEYRNQLPWLDFANCYHRYTFSHAMLRGQNILVFAIVGACVACVFIMVEINRVGRLQALLKFHLMNISTADEADQSQAASRVLRILPVYTVTMTVAFMGVLLLAIFHLDRPALHYATTGLAAGSMFMGVCLYISLPLEQAVGLSHTDEVLESASVSLQLRQWAQRHQLLRNWSGIVVALHIALPSAAALHHFAWVDPTGRLFGALEVLTILSYQFFVGFLANDDFAIQRNDAQDPCISQTPSAKNVLTASGAAVSVTKSTVG